jgi:hypothetical protein
MRGGRGEERRGEERRGERNYAMCTQPWDFFLLILFPGICPLLEYSSSYLVLRFAIEGLSF